MYNINSVPEASLDTPLLWVLFNATQFKQFNETFYTFIPAISYDILKKAGLIDTSIHQVHTASFYEN